MKSLKQQPFQVFRYNQSIFRSQKIENNHNKSQIRYKTNNHKKPTLYDYIEYQLKKH